MGQRQLFIFSCTIIVFVVALVTITIFGQSAEDANIDALRQDVLVISTMSQEWYNKPKKECGCSTFTGVNIYELEFVYDTDSAEVGGTIFTNANGSFILEVNDDLLTVTAQSNISNAVITATVAPHRVFTLFVTGREGNAIADVN